MLTLQTEAGARPCCLCGKWLSAYVLFDESVDRTVDGICQKCVDDHHGPGKFQEFHDDEDIARALILQHWANESGEDEFMWADGYGYCGRFENCLLIQDSQGFISVEVYDSDEKASKEYMDYYEDGWGAGEDDIYVGDNWRNGCPEIFDADSRKSIEIWPRKDGSCPETRVDAAIYLHMIKTGYYPNVWDSLQYGVRLRKMHNFGDGSFLK